MTSHTSTTGTRRKAQVIHLRHGDDSHVTVVPEDRDRFVLRVRSVVESLSAVASYQLQLELLLEVAGAWVFERRASIEYAALAINGQSFNLILARGAAFSMEFEEEMSDLERAVVCNDGSLNMVKHFQAIAFYGGSKEDVIRALPRDAPLILLLRPDDA